MSHYHQSNQKQSGNNFNISNFSNSKRTPFVSKIVPESPGYADLNHKKQNLRNFSASKDKLQKNPRSNHGNSNIRSPSDNNPNKNIEEDVYVKKNLRNNSSSRSIGKSGNQSNHNEIRRKRQNESQEFYENEDDNRFTNKRNNIPKINSHSSKGNKFGENNKNQEYYENQSHQNQPFRETSPNQLIQNHNLNFINENHKVLDEFIENNNLNKFVANEYIENEMSLNQQMIAEESFNDRLVDASGRNYYQEANEEEENQYNNNENYEDQEVGEHQENEDNQFYEENENYDEIENDNDEDNQTGKQPDESFRDKNHSRRNENSSNRISISHDDGKNIDISNIDLNANIMKAKLRNEISKAEYSQNKSNITNTDNSSVINNHGDNRSNISVNEPNDKLESKKINIEVVNENSNNKITANNVMLENLSEKFIYPPLAKENQGPTYRNAANFIDNPNKNKLKVNLAECSKEELELLEKLSYTKSIKIENEDYFRNTKNELILKIERNNLMNKDNKDSIFNIHHHPLKKESFINEKEKFIYLEIISFKNILNQHIQEKKEKDFEINNLKEIIKRLNDQLVSKDEMIKNNIEINNKYNDLLKEFFNLQENTKKLLNENALLKNSVTEVSNLNEVILKNYQNKLFDFGDFSNKLFSVYIDENIDKN